MLSIHPEVTVQIIIPARNEEDCIGRCLKSLVRQQGISFQIMVVDDGSTDGTKTIAEAFSGVKVIGAPELAPGISGKCNALIEGARYASAKWLLFTDADTFHYPGSLAKAVHEAEERQIDLLSYSPEQEMGSFAEMALMPVIFAELARTYPPERVNNPEEETVAANGQYILVRRLVYEALGGHLAIQNEILEDIELARKFKVSHYKIWFRQGAGLVRTRMYRNFAAMWEGWTKNLALLFPSPLRLAARRGLEFAAVAGFATASVVLARWGFELLGLISLISGLLIYALFLRRIRRAHFSFPHNLLALFGLPVFVLLLLRSNIHSNIRGAVRWKGRYYGANLKAESIVDSSVARESELKPTTKS